MKLASGVDLIEIERVRQVTQRYEQRFLGRIFTQQELQDARDRVESLATRFAAKEAAAKALGTGIGPVTWQEIEVREDSSGAPSLHLSGTAAKLAARLGLQTWSVSLSHSHTHAIALVVAVGEDA